MDVHRWNTLSEPWKAAFEEAWASYCAGTFPIGAVIVDGIGNIIARGRNKVYEQDVTLAQVSGNKIAHAEINALLKIDNLESNPDVKDYEIYTTMEPCPLCFGALVMSSVRNIHYAAKDGVAGATDLREGNAYLRSKTFQIDGPHEQLEILQIVLKTDFVLRRGHIVDRLLGAWRKDCPEGVALGEEWFRQNKLQYMKEQGKEMSEVYSEFVRELVSRPIV